MTRKVHTYCRICEAACGLVAETDDRGRVTRLVPNRAHPVSHGYVCAKGTRFHELTNHPERLLRPSIRRAGGALEAVSWKEALAELRDRVRPIVERHGPHAVGLYFGNPLAFNALGTIAMMGFVKSLGTRNVFNAGSQDCNNKFAGAKIVHGSPIIHPIPDLEHTELAVVLGSNPWVSQASFVHLGGGPSVFERIVERGGEVVWVDPRRTESAERCGRHLAIRPATDAWLLLALLREAAARAPAERLADARVEGLEPLLEVASRVSTAEAARHTGLAEAEIVDLSERIARAGSTAFHLSVGVNQSGFGTLAYVTMQALAFVTGNLDRRGGSLFHPAAVLGAKAYVAAGLHRERTSRVGAYESTMGGMPGGILADEILTPGPDRIRAMIVVAGNPLSSIPGGDRLREAFERLDVLACVDSFENDTGALADVLLPASTWLERWDASLTSLPLTAGRTVQLSRAVSRPRGEARNDVRILSDLAVALGGSAARWRIGRLPWDRLPSPRHGVPGLVARPGRYLGRGPLRPGRRVCFWDPALAADVERLSGDAERRAETGFVLLGRRRRLGHNSWIQGATRSGNPEEVAWLRAEELAELGVPGGGEVIVESEVGRIRIRAVPAEGLAPRTVVVPHGLPGLNVNAILPVGPDAIERVSGQQIMTAIPVRVTAA